MNSIDIVLLQIVGSTPPYFLNTYSLYNCMLTVISPRDNQDSPVVHKQRMEKVIDDTIQVHMAQWRFLPPIITNAHVKILQVGKVEGLRAGTACEVLN